MLNISVQTKESVAAYSRKCVFAAGLSKRFCVKIKFTPIQAVQLKVPFTFPTHLVTNKRDGLIPHQSTGFRTDALQGLIPWERWPPRPPPTAPPLPDGLVRQPAGVALLVAAAVGGVELLRGGDGRPDPGAGRLGLGKSVGVAGRPSSVMEDDPCKARGEATDLGGRRPRLLLLDGAGSFKRSCHAALLSPAPASA